MRAVTDSGPTEMDQTPPESIQNLFSLMNVVSTPDTVEFFKEKYSKCEIRYGDMKKQLAEDIIKFTSPFRQKIIDIYNDDKYLSKVVRMGAEKARESTSKTLKEVREIIGFKKYETNAYRYYNTIRKNSYNSS